MRIARFSVPYELATGADPRIKLLMKDMSVLEARIAPGFHELDYTVAADCFAEIGIGEDIPKYELARKRDSDGVVESYYLTPSASCAAVRIKALEAKLAEAKSAQTIIPLVSRLIADTKCLLDHVNIDTMTRVRDDIRRIEESKN